MKKFSQIIKEEYAISGLSAKHSKLKQSLLSMLKFDSKEALKQLLSENVKGFGDEQAITIRGLQTYDELFKFWSENADTIDLVLNENQWYNTSPYGLKLPQSSMKNYIIESTKFAMMKVCELLLKEIV